MISSCQFFLSVLRGHIYAAALHVFCVHEVYIHVLLNVCFLCVIRNVLNLKIWRAKIFNSKKRSAELTVY